MSVDHERRGSPGYRVEGLSNDSSRFVLWCHAVPPPLFPKDHLTREQLVERYSRYETVEKFRKAAEKVDFASEITPGVMILYATPVEQNRALDEFFDQRAILNRIPNGNDVFPAKVSSSNFRNWQGGIGYEVGAQTSEESLTLGCTEGKNTRCVSLVPKTYRAIRDGSEVRLYDTDLNLLGVYRILREEPQP